MMKLPFDLAARAPYLAPDFPPEEYAARQALVRARMADAGLDVLLVYCGPTSYASMRWLTNYQPVGGSCFAVLRSDGGITVTTDGVLHAEPMHSMVWTCIVEDLRCAAGPVYGGAADDVATLAADAAGAAGRIGLAGSNAIPPILHAALLRRFPDMIVADAVITGARMLKSPNEIKMMEESGRIADAAFGAVFDALAPGVLETDVAAAAVATMLRMGAIESFRTCVVGGALAGLKHSFPKMRRLEAGEMVFLDLGANFRNYVSDTSRTCVVGERPRGRAAGLLAVSEDLYAAGLEKMKPGNTIDDVAQALKKVVAGTEWERDFYPGGFGHGVGMDLFEAPGGLFVHSPVVLTPGMTLAYEPMVVVEGLGTGVVEDTLLITDTGYRLLTDSPHQPPSAR